MGASQLINEVGVKFSESQYPWQIGGLVEGNSFSFESIWPCAVTTNDRITAADSALERHVILGYGMFHIELTCVLWDTSYEKKWRNQF